jgi:hypothetical protein
MHAAALVQPSMKSFRAALIGCMASQWLLISNIIFWEFLNGYSIFDVFGQSLIKLCHFGPLVLNYSSAVLREPS